MFRRFQRARGQRVLVLGLDCASPDLIFDTFRDDLPTMRRLMTSGTWGKLESSIPCITVPAWASMTSSRDPGVLGVYGFRNRRDHSYDQMTLADGALIRVPRVWDHLSAAGKESLLVGVPQTYPIRPIKGHVVSDFLTPGLDSAFTYPAMLKHEVLTTAPEYRFDVYDFRTDDKDRLLHDILHLTEVQMRVFKDLLRRKSWDLAMHVVIGLDRLHHGFWRFHDPVHRLYEAGNRFEGVIRDYYRRLDAHLAEVITLAGEDTAVLVVSDHGVSRMDGGVCINEWLWNNGWLRFKTPPGAGGLTRIEDCDIDWDGTQAWASGGYYGRIFLNVRGREPQGTIAPENYQTVRDRLAAEIAAIPGVDGAPLNTQVFKPEAIYQHVNGVAPDLIVYFGDLHWRAVGSVGHGSHLTFENDTGPDDANHSTHGMFIWHQRGVIGRGCVDGHQLMDIAPTLLNAFNLPIPSEMQGRRID